MSHESISKAASGTTYAGSALAAGSAAAASVQPVAQDVIFGLTVNQWSVIGIAFGMLMALVGWLTNLYYRRQHFKLAETKAREWTPLGDE